MSACDEFLSLNKTMKDRNHKLIQFIETSPHDAVKCLPSHIDAMEISGVYQHKTSDYSKHLKKKVNLGYIIDKQSEKMS